MRIAHRRDRGSSARARRAEPVAPGSSASTRMSWSSHHAATRRDHACILDRAGVVDAADLRAHRRARKRLPGSTSSAVIATPVRSLQRARSRATATAMTMPNAPSTGSSSAGRSTRSTWCPSDSSRRPACARPRARSRARSRSPSRVRVRSPMRSRPGVRRPRRGTAGSAAARCTDRRARRRRPRRARARCRAPSASARTRA